jgi:hypothetical protein
MFCLCVQWITQCAFDVNLDQPHNCAGHRPAATFYDGKTDSGVRNVCSY